MSSLATPEREDLTAIRKQLLNKRDVLSEEYLGHMMEEISEGIPQHLTQSEKNDLITKMMLERLHHVGTSLAVKLTALVKAMVEFRLSKVLEDELATISMPELLVAEKATIYSRMFFNFAESEYTSYAVDNASSLGGLTHLELFILTFFIFSACRRTKNDGMLQLYISGINSCGKSRLIEAPLLEHSHQLVISGSNDAGCGRFVAKHKHILLCHDVPVSVLFGPDMTILKCVCRSEQTAAKVHSGTAVIPLLHVLITSNDRLCDHVVQVPGSFLPLKLPSQAQGAGVKRVKDQHLFAMRARFLEVHVRKRCRQTEDDLRESGSFRRIHLILGLYRRVLDIVSCHTPEDFATKHLYYYALSALEKNLDNYTCHYNIDKHTLRLQIDSLKEMYKVT